MIGFHTRNFQDRALISQHDSFLFHVSQEKVVLSTARLSLSQCIYLYYPVSFDGPDLDWQKSMRTVIPYDFFKRWF